MQNKDLLANLMKPKAVEPLRDLSAITLVAPEPILEIDVIGAITETIPIHPELFKLQDTITNIEEARAGRKLNEIPLEDGYWDVEEAHKNQYRKCKDLGLLG